MPTGVMPDVDFNAEGSGMIMGRYDPALRAADKQRSRDQDEADLRAGRLNAGQLQHRNSLFSGFDVPAAVVTGWKAFG